MLTPEEQAADAIRRLNEGISRLNATLQDLDGRVSQAPNRASGHALASFWRGFVSGVPLGVGIGLVGFLLWWWLCG